MLYRPTLTQQTLVIDSDQTWLAHDGQRLMVHADHSQGANEAAQIEQPFINDEVATKQKDLDTRPSSREEYLAH